MKIEQNDLIIKFNKLKHSLSPLTDLVALIGFLVLSLGYPFDSYAQTGCGYSTKFGPVDFSLSYSDHAALAPSAPAWPYAHAAQLCDEGQQRDSVLQQCQSFVTTNLTACNSQSTIADLQCSLTPISSDPESNFCTYSGNCTASTCAVLEMITVSPENKVHFSNSSTQDWTEASSAVAARVAGSPLVAAARAALGRTDAHILFCTMKSTVSGNFACNFE